MLLIPISFFGDVVGCLAIISICALRCPLQGLCAVALSYLGSYHTSAIWLASHWAVLDLLTLPAVFGDRLCAYSYAFVAIHNKNG